jgi:hypothetical protein
MADPLPATGTGVTTHLVPAAKKRGPKGGKNAAGIKRKNKSICRVKGRVCKKQRNALVAVAEPPNNYDEVALSDVSECSNATPITTIPVVTTATVEGGESNSEIKYRDKEDNAGIENIDGLNELFDERTEPVFKSETVQRLAIGYMFFKTFGAPEDHQEWRDRNICPQIRKAFNLDDGSRIDHILNDVVACKKAGIEYRGSRKIGASVGRRPILRLDSMEAQIIADCFESGFSISLTQWLVYQHRKETQQPSLTQSPIQHLMTRMKPVVRIPG